jgi:hypothetical protein
MVNKNPRLDIVHCSILDTLGSSIMTTRQIWRTVDFICDEKVITKALEYLVTHGCLIELCGLYRKTTKGHLRRVQGMAFIEWETK